MQFRQGDVAGGSERGQRGNQPQFAAIVAAQQERNSEAKVVGAGVCWGQGFGYLLKDLVLHADDFMATPCRVADSGSAPTSQPP